MPRLLLILAGCTLLAAGSAARADSVRLAIVVGNNIGHGSRPPLHFAEDDAAKFARVLTELGGVSPSDLYLLQGKNREALEETFDRVAQRIGALHGAPGHRATLIFYFSGHSDGTALELGQDRLPFTELQARLKQSGAEIRVAIADSCRSGALLAAKGGRLSQPFENPIVRQLRAGRLGAPGLQRLQRGRAGVERNPGLVLHPSLDLGLRGAADASGDGRVTLAEAYKYAYERTLAATSQTLAGPQHPSYDIRLAGVGELVLTQLTRPSGALVLPAGFERALVSEPTRDEVLAEVPAGAPPRVAVPPGDYLVRLWRKGEVYSGRVLVGRNEAKAVAWESLQPIRLSSAQTTAKGGSADVSAADLAEGLQKYRQLDYDDAVKILHRVVGRQPPKAVAAKAHVYLGVIALNLSSVDQAKEEFRLALVADATAELPYEASPKARTVFAEAQRDFDAELQARRVSGGVRADVPPAVVPVVVEAAGEPPKASSHPSALAVVLGSVGVVAGAVAVYGGIQVLNYNNNVGAGNSNQGTMNMSTLGPRSTAQFWAVSWLIFAGLGAAGLTAAALAW